MQQRRSFCAVLALLALLGPLTQDVLALWSEGHGHDHAHGSHGWGHRSADHARHDDSQLETIDPVQRFECALCAYRSRTDVPLLFTPASVARQDSGYALSLAVSLAELAQALSSSRQRAPPTV